MRTLLIAAVVLGGSAFLAPLHAQNARESSARGLAWVGCWEAADGIQAEGRVCVIPEGARDLRIVSFDTQDRATESTLRLNGERTPVSAEGCTGWEQARMSADGDRILVDAQLQCGDTPQRTISEAFVITPAGFWLQARGAGVAMVASARIRLYRAVDSYASFPADIRAALVSHVREAEYARNAMTERQVSARDLAELESMGVAAPLIDLVVAASYPSSFVIDAEGAAARPAGVQARTSSLNANPFYWANGFPMLSYYDLAMLDNCVRFRMFTCAIGGSRYGYSAFGRGGYGYGDPYYGGGYYGGGYYGGYGQGGLPVVVRPASPSSDFPGNRGGGRAVSGSGYTSGSSGGSGSGTRSASPRSGTTGTSQNSGSAGASTSSGSGGSGGSSSAGTSGGSATRTAKPRTP